MNIKIKAVDIEMTDAIHEYANKKVSEALAKFGIDSNENVLVEVELSKTNKHHSNGDVYKASARVDGYQKNIFVEAVKDDLYASIDLLKDKLEEVISGVKSKKKSVSNRLAAKFKSIFKRGE